MVEQVKSLSQTPQLHTRASDYASLCEAFQASVINRGDAPALRSTHSDARWSWHEAGQAVERLAGGLAALGVAEGETVALLLRNRPEFNLVDTAAFHLGATPWSIYLTSAPSQINRLLQGSQSRVVISESDLLPRLREAAVDTAVEHIIDVEQLHTLPQPPDGFDFGARWRAVRPDTPLTIIWTSGTTGEPKAVVLTHGAMLELLEAVTDVAGVDTGGRIMSYLPSAHVGDRWSAHCWWMTLGAELTCVQDMQTVGAATAALHPTIWGSVPRVWEKLRAALEAQGVTNPANLSEDAKAALRTKLGLDQAQFLVSGAAPLAADTLRFFDDFGLAICELWGMSESCGVLTSNSPAGRRIGTVGRPLPGVNLRIADDGEILARAPMLMLGYRNQPELTRTTVDDGWLYTGDVGEIDADGFLSIVGRKKELIINAAGKNMSPVAIEAELTTAGPLIGQACVIGDRRPFNVALLVLDADGLGAWARQHDRTDSPFALLSSDPEVLASVTAEVRTANARLSRVEQIKAWHVVEGDWLPDSDELTPTMKLKRHRIYEKYETLIDALYSRANAGQNLAN